MLSAASFDGRISVYSIMGGSTDGLRQKQVDQVLKIVQLRMGTERGGRNKIWDRKSGGKQNVESLQWLSAALLAGVPLQRK